MQTPSIFGNSLQEGSGTYLASTGSEKSSVVEMLNGFIDFLLVGGNFMLLVDGYFIDPLQFVDLVVFTLAIFTFYDRKFHFIGIGLVNFDFKVVVRCCSRMSRSTSEGFFVVSVACTFSGAVCMVMRDLIVLMPGFSH